LIEFFRWTVYARPTLIIFFIAFVLLGYVNPALILFGIVDLLGAIWTGLALRSDKTPSKNLADTYIHLPSVEEIN